MRNAFNRDYYRIIVSYRYRDNFDLSYRLSIKNSIWHIVTALDQYRHFLNCRHRSVPVPCENSSAETTVAEGGKNPVAGLWGYTLGEN